MNKYLKWFLIVLQFSGSIVQFIAAISVLRRFNFLGVSIFILIFGLNLTSVYMLLRKEKPGLVFTIINYLLQTVLISLHSFVYFYYSGFSYFMGIFNNQLTFSHYFGSQVIFSTNPHTAQLGIGFNLFALIILFTIFFQLGKLTCANKDEED